VGQDISPFVLKEKIKCMEEIKSRLKLGNACYYSVQNLLSSSLLSKKLKIKIDRTKILVYIYIKRTNVMQFGSMFICNCNIALHVSDAFCLHLQEHLEIVEASRWFSYIY